MTRDFANRDGVGTNSRSFHNFRRIGAPGIGGCGRERGEWLGESDGGLVLADVDAVGEGLVVEAFAVRPGAGTEAGAVDEKPECLGMYLLGPLS